MGVVTNGPHFMISSLCGPQQAHVQSSNPETSGYMLLKVCQKQNRLEMQLCVESMPCMQETLASITRTAAIKLSRQGVEEEEEA